MQALVIGIFTDNVFHSIDDAIRCIEKYNVLLKVVLMEKCCRLGDEWKENTFRRHFGQSLSRFGGQDDQTQTETRREPMRCREKEDQWMCKGFRVDKIPEPFALRLDSIANCGESLSLVKTSTQNSLGSLDDTMRRS